MALQSILRVGDDWPDIFQVLAGQNWWAQPSYTCPDCGQAVQLIRHPRPEFATTRGSCGGCGVGIHGVSVLAAALGISIDEADRLVLRHLDGALEFDPAAAARMLAILGIDTQAAHLRAIHWDRSLPPERSAMDLPPGDPRRQDLAGIQQQGYNLYLGAGGGRRDSEIATVQYVWAEWDGLHPREVIAHLQELGASGLPDPTLLLTTWDRGSVHAWWRLDEPLPVEEWRTLMRRLVICLGSDRTCVNPSRVMRLAGSVYWAKAGRPDAGQPLGLATILDAETTEATTTAQELQLWSEHHLHHHPELLEVERTEAEVSTAPPTDADRAARNGRALLPPRPLEQVQAALACIPRRVSGLPDSDPWKYPAHRFVLAGLRDALYRIHRQGSAAEPDLDAAALAQAQAIEMMEAHSPSQACGWNITQVLTSSAWLDEGNLWKRAGEAGFSLKGQQKQQAPTADGVPKAMAPNPANVTGIEAVLLAAGSGWVPQKDGPPKRSALPVGDLSQKMERGLRDRLGFDELNLMPAVDGRPLSGPELDFLHVRLSENGWKNNKSDATDAVMRAAHRHPFHPVQQDLERIAATVDPLPIEQWERLDLYLLGITDPIAAEFLPQYLISAVARLFRPGCGVRRSPVFIGPQHRGKTALGRILFGPDQWVEGLQGGNDRDMRTRCHRAWGVELSELNGITRRSDQESIKAFLTERTDILRRAYGRTEEVLPRRFVFWGTSNGPPLRDLSGSTRFVCIPLPDRMLPLDWAIKNRDAIWSRAVDLFRQIPADQEPWDTPSEECRLAVAERNANHQEVDPWADAIEVFLRDRIAANALPVKLPELLAHLEVPRERQSNAAGARVRAVAESLGWVLQQRWIDRKTGMKARGLWPPVAHTGPHRAHTGPTPADPSAEEGSLPMAHRAHTNSLKLEREGELSNQGGIPQGLGAFGVGHGGHPGKTSPSNGSEPPGCLSCAA